ncbi:hypothetical protein [Weissella confusa]|uniref:hypothetical protein n=1 Tax=Weissella confusa TaxID=1583 RepID=UPI00223B3816|nr:hypothetical protein [Weissella confusa]MCT0013513.1 hypothetical protein [Weissella confusa]
MKVKVTKVKVTKVNVTLVLLFIGWTLAWTLINFKNNMIPAAGDTFFHVQRIYEIRESFANFKLPSFFNWMTFHHTGQAVNLMYPDVTMWPLVLITNWLSPVRQVVTIQLLTLWVSFIVTFLAGKKRFGTDVALVLAFVISLSGKILSTVSAHIQTSPELAVVAIFPIFLILFDVWELPDDSGFKEMRKLFMPLVLWMVWMVYSHLLTALIMGVIVISVLLTKMLRNGNFRELVTGGAIPAIVGLVAIVPMFYRLSIGYRTGVLPPATVDLYASSLRSVQDLWTEAGFASDLPLIAFLMIIIMLLSRDIIKQIPGFTFLVSLSGILLFFSTKLFPWMLFNKIPILSQLQSPTTRILPFVFPIILIGFGYYLKARKLKSVSILALILVVALYAAAGTLQYQRSFGNKEIITDKVVNRTQATMVSPQGDPARLTDKAIEKGYNAGTFYDYIPEASGKVPSSSAWLPTQNVVETANQIGLINGKKQKFKIGHTFTNGIRFNVYAKSGDYLELPVWKYSYNGYRVLINGEAVRASKSSMGRFLLQTKETGSQNVEVREKTDKLYLLLLVLSVADVIWALVWVKIDL